MENLSINTMSDVRSFFYYLIHECELGAGFHPDTPISEYVVVGTGKPTFTRAGQIEALQAQLDRCYQVCLSFNEDIYEQGVEPRAYIQMLTPEKHPPMEINGYLIQWNDYWGAWMVDKEDCVTGQFDEFQDAVEYALKG